MNKVILIKYGELTTKDGNRNLFINLLYENIKNLLEGFNVKISKNRVRMFIETDEDIEKIVEMLKKVFGIHSIAIVYKVNTNIEEIKKLALEVCKKNDFATFKVETKRSYKEFPIPSMEFNNLIGGLILKNIEGKKVNVHTPDFILKIEIRDNYTYIYDKEVMGSGGYPLGVAGKGLLMLSGGIDSPVAGYLAMKRGVKLECIYFESPPHTSEQALNKVKKLTSKLAGYQGNIVLHVVNFTHIQEEIYKNCDPNYMITIMRRMMYRISKKIMDKRNALILVNGESIGQVASQTLTSMNVINRVVDIPVIRPLACYDKLEIIDIAKKIGTYDTSILPYEDCCTIFLPKHPVINPKEDKVLFEEEKLDYKLLVEEAINNTKKITINKNYLDINI